MRAVLQEDRCFAVSAPNGNMRANSPDGHGLWVGDTRMLSDFVLRIDGREPVSVRVWPEPGSLRLDAKAAGLDVVRERYVDGGMHERIVISNRGQAAIAADVDLSFGSDYVDMMALRGFAPGLPRPERPLTTEIGVTPAGATHRIEMAGGASFTLVVDVLGRQDFDLGLRALRASYRKWAADCASFETDNRALNELLERSRDDLRMLAQTYPTGIYPTGGVPWYAVPFGRDALITALFLLPVNPEVARGTLRFLAAHQGRRADAGSEEQPGKIPHEVRTGEVVEGGLWPHIFYGTVDATPLYVWTLAETVDWTASGELLVELWSSAKAALGWCETDGDPDRDGYLEYGIKGRGRNQGWKDSDNSLTNVDGSDPIRPTALCEVQGYWYSALRAMARRRPELTAKAGALRENFNRDFWMPAEGFVAQALDAAKQQVRAVTSNPGHCLWTGLLEPDHARAVARRLLEPDMFSGWGIRTLSANAISYKAEDGANGAVWAHDSAIAAAGMRRTGRDDAAELVARSVLEAGAAFPSRRIPEFWCGTRREAEAPVEFRNSCSPQSWSAAAPFSLMSTMLGLQADATRGILRIQPCRTSLWNRLEVTGLHFGGHRLDFAVEDGRVRLGATPRGIKVEIA